MRLTMSVGTAGIFRPTELRSRNNQQMPAKIVAKKENRFNSLIHSDITMAFNKVGKVYACVWGSTSCHENENKKRFLIFP